jgi:hypothetical protein
VSVFGERGHLGDIGVGGFIYIKMRLKYTRCVRIQRINLAQERVLVLGSCERGNELSVP